MKFCTYLTVYSGDKLPAFYIGSTSIARIENKYHGSVRSKALRSLWEAELINHPELFDTRVLTKHQTHKDALLKEADIQKMFDVVRSPLFANAAYARGGFLNVKPHTQETKDKIRATLSGRKMSEEQIEKVRKIHLGRKNSKETKERMRQSALGRKNSLEHNIKCGLAFKGRTHTEETKAKMRVAQSARWAAQGAKK